MRKLIVSPFTLALLAVLLSLVANLAFAQTNTNPFGDIIPQQQGAALDSQIAQIAKFIVIAFGLGILAGGLGYGGWMVIAKAKESSTSKEGAGNILGAVVMALVLIAVTAVIGGALLIGADAVATTIDGIFA